MNEHMLWFIELTGILIVSYVFVMWLISKLTSFFFTEVDLSTYHKENALRKD